MHEEREARLVHRIESFSDLVIGFSLALLGLTLVIPAHATELLAHPARSGSTTSAYSGAFRS